MSKVCLFLSRAVQQEPGGIPGSASDARRRSGWDVVGCSHALTIHKDCRRETARQQDVRRKELRPHPSAMHGFITQEISRGRISDEHAASP
ncbi:hypothetical protein O3P69_007463 [Scylla paramamosain]|uniref:Uncharacterized protein n=1 Tax=Scylla paramamosain TaxID=85552 RepID=A0AAW0V4V0_SCYPA